MAGKPCGILIKTHCYRMEEAESLVDDARELLHRGYEGIRQHQRDVQRWWQELELP